MASRQTDCSSTGGSEFGLGAGFSLNSPLVGRVDIEHADAEVIHKELEKVETSIVIPYGYLQLNKSDVIGSGGTARVYRAIALQRKTSARACAADRTR